MTASSYSEPKAREMAKVVLTKTLRIRPGETVTIETWDGTLPWANAFVLEARRLGAVPLLLYNDETTYWKSIDVAGPKSLGTVGRHEWAMLERTDAYVNFWGPADVPREGRLPSATQSAVTAYEDRWFEIANRTGLRMARLYLGRVGEAAAQAFDIDPEAWRRELVDATLVDPITMHRAGQRLAERLRKGTTLEVRHSNGTELHLKLRHREPRIDSGVLPPRNGGRTPRIRGHSGLLDVSLPAGVIMVAVDEEFGEGRIQATEPTDTSAGQLTGGSWELHDGRLTRHAYRSGGDLFDTQLAEAGPMLARPGAIGIGLNPKIRRAPMMRDQILGAVCFTLGGNRYWGGQTDGHGFHPYIVLTDAEVRIDGKPVVGPVG